MRMTIDSRIAGARYEFWAPDQGGYVRLEFGDRIGTLGSQICDGGGFTGSTIWSTPASFADDCRRWYRQHLRVEGYR
ncbi:hypothetical protein [Mycobacterium canetti]|uniref:hypothetical protein n=1 Tax=Mycobacterium canetti TaxID=78331 RepID=UPI000347A10E|nr:hypothetical protein [Mycobacterium canetti]